MPFQMVRPQKRSSTGTDSTCCESTLCKWKMTCFNRSMYWLFATAYQCVFCDQKGPNLLQVGPVSCKRHISIRMTPAQAAGVESSAWIDRTAYVTHINLFCFQASSSERLTELRKSCAKNV